MKKCRLGFTREELVALSGRLVPISPAEYDLHTYAILRHLYGRFEREIFKLDNPRGKPENKKKGV